MTDTRIKLSSVVENQLPGYIREQYPLVKEFLSQYYRSLDSQSGVYDILQNIDKYVKLESLVDIVDSTTLTSDVDFSDTRISVNSTSGFPDTYGLLKIGSEIITYTSKTDTTFDGCTRGFSGITSNEVSNKPDQLVFSTTELDSHSVGDTVNNLSILFLKEFFKKVKKQFIPGFEGRDLNSNVNAKTFISRSKDFYSSKGTDESFKILFRAFYGEDVEIIKPRDYLFTPSNAQYRVTKDLVVDVIEGNPELLVNKTLYQDQYGSINASFGSISNVEKIYRNGKYYYKLSLDYDYNKDIISEGSVFGKFSIHPQTTIISDTKVNSSFIDVDSTIGFPESGELILSFTNGTTLTIQYTSKSYSQFLGCSGITQNLDSGQKIRLNTFAYGYVGTGTDEQVKVRITGVLSDIDPLNNPILTKRGDKISIKTFGRSEKDLKEDIWFYNIPVSYNVKNIQVVDSSNNTYQVETYDINRFIVGDKIKLYFTNTDSIISYVDYVIDTNSFIFSGQGLIDTTKLYKIEKIVLKPNFLNYPNNNIFSTNVQNVYYDVDEKATIIASNSLPSYFNESIKVADRSVTFSGTFNGENINIQKHGFYTGDSVTYKPVSDTNTLNISEGIYYIFKIDENNIKLSYSRFSLYKKKYITVTGTITNNKFEYSNLSDKELSGQKLVRKIKNPVLDNKENTTNTGAVGILANGVEILNYKSKDKVYFGPIQKIEVISSGSNYDIINPPTLQIIDDYGSDAVGYCEVVGGVKRIDIIDGGFDYVTEPVISISGGNGYGASAKAKLIEFVHERSFNSISSSGLVNLTDNIIGLSSHHKFRDAERVQYFPDGQQIIGGLSTSTFYYVSVQDAFNVKLHNTKSDAISGINTVSLTSYGVGVHRLVSANVKKKISSIEIENSGTGYKTRKISVPSSGINTASDIITAKEHKYSSGELVVYNTSLTEVGGLTDGQSYYVTVVDEDSFRLSKIGTSTTLSDFYYQTNQYIDLTSVGSGYHQFNYPPVTVKVEGIIGVSTFTGQNLAAKVQPIVRGQIESVFLENGGKNYGSEEILNYNRQAKISTLNGSGAQIVPVISKQSIVEILVISGGSGYVSPPEFEFIGPGTGAVLTPVLSNGSLVEVKVIKGGIEYIANKSSINVIPSGSGASFYTRTKEWNVNLFERIVKNNQIKDDDGIISESLNSQYGLQYFHLYAPRKLRQSVLTFDGIQSYTQDLIIENNIETLSKLHSPIIGWSYDGNPIYGPYGYEKNSNSKIKAIESGYVLKTSLGLNRPNTSFYPKGFFVEDYEFNSSGDLDEHNGRFCITPEYPNGTYAYFATIDGKSVSSSGPFKNFRKPVFPYFIGNTYKSKPINENFLPHFNQDKVDLNSKNILRNTRYYNILNKNSGYEYLEPLENVRRKNSTVVESAAGTMSSIGILTGGNGYKVGDRLIFNNKNSSGQSAAAEVKSILGKTIDQISVNNTSILNVEFYSQAQNNDFIAISESPHNLVTGDIVNITGLSTLSTYISNLYSIGVTSETALLSTGIGTTGATGIVTYFNLFTIPPTTIENDIFTIGSEKVKVLSIDTGSNRILVKRSIDGTVGSSHSSSTILYDNPRKFTFGAVLDSSLAEYSKKRQQQIYFNPSESVGLGTLNGVGIGTTITFSNPGTGITSLFIPTRSIYLLNHGLETGDSLTYSSDNENPISVSTDGVSSFQLTENQIVYAAKINENLIGIATNRVGLNSVGSFVGIDSSVTTDILYFTGIGIGSIHSFTTNYEKVITGDVSKNLVTVSTASSHGLSKDDVVRVECISGVSTSHTIKYNKYNNRLVIDPRDFVSGDVNTSTNTITINNHGYYTGQKVIYTSTSPSGGLTSNQIYYVVKIDNNKIKLSTTYYDSTILNPICIDITSASLGTISPINPPITLFKNQTVTFDVSDSSLSYLKGSVRKSSFDFVLYDDKNLVDVFKKTKAGNDFDVVKTGSIGVDANAKVTINVNSEFPESLYYTLVLVNKEENPLKTNPILDSSNITENNKLKISDSIYSGVFALSGVTTSAFTYNVVLNPEKSSYLSTEASLKYTTTSTNTSGSINETRITSVGRNYLSLPGITSISSVSGSGAVLEVNTTNIGKVKEIQIDDIGLEFYSDKTLRPTAKLPQNLKVTVSNKFKKIGISSAGKYYNTAPDLIVIDSLTDKVISEVDLSYEVGDSIVTILNNTNSLSNIPKIIPVNNSNGIGINSITFNSSTKDVTIGLAVSYSSGDDYPFAVGEKVLIESTSVGLGSTGRGYNSSAYNYALFTLTGIHPNIGGAAGIVTFNLNGYLKDGEIPGDYAPEYSFGKIVPERFFPLFNIELESADFYPKEIITTSNGKEGVVEEWDFNSNTLRVSGIDSFTPKDIIIGQSSGLNAEVKSSLSNIDAIYEISPSSIVRKGWNTNSGFLNDSLQAVQDSDYYQNFSYSIKSKVPHDKWKNLVDANNHTAGFKQFSDLILESNTSLSGVSTEQTESKLSVTVDIDSTIDLECVENFDLAKERVFKFDSNKASDEIILKSKIIQDYIQSIGNRVLKIDDVSLDFNNVARTDKNSTVGKYRKNNFAFKKILAFIKDRIYTGNRQINFVSILNKSDNVYLNQYAKVYTNNDMGDFDAQIFGDEIYVNYYPVDYEVNDFNVSLISYDIKDTLSGVGTFALGDIVNINSSNSIIPSGSTSENIIVGIASTNTSAKVLVEIGGTDGSYYESNEILLVHNGSEISLTEYGQLISSVNTNASFGIGTYGAYYSGDIINLTLTPNVGVGVSYIINTLNVSIANTTSSTGVGTTTLRTGKIDSHYTSISSSGSPTSNVVAQYLNTSYNASYYIVSIDDTTNNQSQVSEIVVVDNGTDVSIIEYAPIYTGSSLGTFSADISSIYTRLLFTPNPSIDIEVKVFQNAIGLQNDLIDNTFIELNSASIRSTSGTYEGTQTDIKRQFNLNHKGFAIFERYFDPENPAIMNIDDNTINIPNHYFVTGEKLSYDHTFDPNNVRISIASTAVSGIGLTDKLPPTVYVVKVNDSTIKLSRSAEDALKYNPNTFEFDSSVGFGTIHRLVATNQNSKVLVTLDNNIQSPLVSTAVTTLLSENLLTTTDELKVDSVSDIIGGDLLRIDDEIVRVKSVGFGSTNTILVDRFWMGTSLQAHTQGSLVTKTEGNYNIVNSKINFATAPAGDTPIGTATNSPHERDWVGITTRTIFTGRTFMRSGVVGSSTDAYSHNYVFDDISSSFNGISSEFSLKSNGVDLAGISTSNAIILINEILQEPQRSTVPISIEGGFTLKESVGITSIQFVGTGISAAYDYGTSNLPIGGIIVSVGSTSGLGYQPLVAAGGTAIISGLGTISSISIGNSGSGYRVGIQTIVNVGVAISSLGTPSIEFIGTAAISGGNVVSVAITNPGFGYTSSNPPIVIFDSPLSYSNIPLIYSSSSSGVGTEAKIDIVVGQGSSIIDFEIRNLGYGYSLGDVLTVSIGGTAGIPTDTSYTFEEFQITVDRIQSDKFNGWSIGDIEVFDSIQNLFDGTTTLFPLKINGIQRSIEKKPGSLIDLDATLLVFVNNILQVPNSGYVFDGGSYIRFTEPPKSTDICSILFYKGTGSVDVADIDILETIKVGDNVRLVDNNTKYDEKTRFVHEVNATDSFNTNPYFGYGIADDENYERPLKWCRQRSDIFVNGKVIGKDRDIYEPRIYPLSNIIQPVSVASTEIFVENVKTFFDSDRENITASFQEKIKIISQDSLVSASATAVVSGIGTISSIVISDGGVGYATTPTVTISNPVGLGTTQRATATASISGGSISSVMVSFAGTGYTTSNPPVVLIESPSPVIEEIELISYSGDFGIVSGVGTTSVGVASTGIVFDLLIPEDSYLRDSTIVGTAITVSGIQTGYYFVVFNSNIGNGVTSIYSNGSVLSIGSTFIDNVYEVASVSIAQTSAYGIGVTYVAQVVVSVSDYNSLSGIGNSEFFGEYSWGRISCPSRSSNTKSFTVYNNGLVGISTSPILERSNPLKYLNYT